MATTQSNEPDKKNNRHVPLVIGSLAAILTPGAYLLGLSYYNGYMTAFGVEADGFPISAPDVYVFSYHTIGFFLLAIGQVAIQAVDKAFTPPNVYWTASILAAAITTIYLLLRLAKRGPYPLVQSALTKVKAVVSWLHWKNNDFTKSAGIVGAATYGVTAFFAFLASIALFWWLLPMGANAKGRDIANERIKAYLEKGCYIEEKTKWNSCFFVVNGKGKTIHEGLLIAVSDKEIAIFKNDGSYVFSRKEDYLLRRKLD